MEIEDFVDDPPLAVDSEQGKYIGKAVGAPVVKFKLGKGDGFPDVDGGERTTEVQRQGILIDPITSP